MTLSRTCTRAWTTMLRLSSQVSALLVVCFMTSSEGYRCSTSKDAVYHGYLVDCYGQGLTSVPEGLPPNTTTLLLADNNIQRLQANAFQHLRKLRKLDISRNGEVTMDNDTFKGLVKLEVLFLYHDDVSKTENYPDVSLSLLPSLTTLHINGLTTDFGPGFSKLRNLRRLYLSSGKCKMRVLRNSTFMNLPFLEALNVSNCDITDTERLVFKFFLNIKTIDLSSNRYLGFTNASKSFFGLRNSSIETLYLNYLYKKFQACSSLEITHVKDLRFTQLTSLHIDGNRIVSVESGVLPSLPKTLKVLSARENRFEFGTYLVQLTSLESLEFLDVSMMNMWYSVPVQLTAVLQRGRLNIPPKLKTFVAEECYMRGVVGNTDLNNNVLQSIRVTGNLIYEITGSIGGLNHIVDIDLSQNIIEHINGFSLEIGQSLQFLNLSHNYLGKQISNDVNGSMFRHLKQLKHLDLSLNLIDRIHQKTFVVMKSLETLNISNNELNDVNEFRIPHSKNLSMIDLSNNRFSRLPQSFLSDIEKLHVRVDLQGNPLQCSCEELYFLKWISMNRHKILNLPSTVCEHDDKYITLEDIIQKITSIEEKCKHSISVMIALLCVVISCVVCGSLCYRYRWTLRYMYYTARRRFWETRQLIEDEFIYDVFVSYAESDRNLVIEDLITELENKAGLKMCIHHRDFLPGEVIASNIVNAIDKSRKTLIILSPAFLESDWCLYEYQMAVQARISRRQNSVLVLLYSPVLSRDLPKDMAALMTTDSYLEHNHEELGRDAFWQSLVDALKTVRPID